MKKVLVFVLCYIILFGWITLEVQGSFSEEELRQQFRELISKEKSQKLSEEADLVFEGTPTKVEFPRTKTVNAKGLESLDESNFVVFFKVEKVIKGECKDKVFSIIVHSPITSFMLFPEEYAQGNGKNIEFTLKCLQKGQQCLLRSYYKRKGYVRFCNFKKKQCFFLKLGL